MLTAVSRRMRIQQGIIGSALSGIQVFSPLLILVISLYMEKNGMIILGQAIATGAVTIENLTFKYTPESLPVVNNVTLDIAVGETVALVGLSGSGKTTFGKLISSLFEPTSGHIYFGGIKYTDR